MSTVPRLSGVQLSAPDGSKPLLVVGPSLGTSVEALWSAAASELADDFHVVGWDLPGHGRSTQAAEPFLVEDLATAVLDLVAPILAEWGEAGGPFTYAGDSLGGAVGLQLLLDRPGQLNAAVLVCTGPQIGTPQDWTARAALVRASGTPALLTSAPSRWFAPDFVERAPEAASRLLHALQDADDGSYAWACDALAAFDVRERLGEIRVPVLAVSGEFDQVTPPSLLQRLADGVRSGTHREVPAAGHLAPVEQPGVLADLIRAQAGAADSVAHVRQAGMRVRRLVLGDAYVERATALADAFSGDFQDLITGYAWGTIWTRPGLDRRMRSAITLTALVAGGHYDELALHVRAALRNGLSVNEIKEVLLQCAIYCGVPSANSAFKVAQAVLGQAGEEESDDQARP